MKLEVGMYVRTIKGKIARIDEVNEETGSGIVCHDYWYESFPTNENFELYKENLVKKASHNIIDLIEVGDYVNGYKVLIKSSECERPILVYGINTNDKQIAITIYEEDIKSIVTKEQFKANEYVIEK